VLGEQASRGSSICSIVGEAAMAVDVTIDSTWHAKQAMSMAADLRIRHMAEHGRQ
jgi:hypothetical protein